MLPPGNPDRPSAARTYDALAGGLDNWQADRELAAAIRGIYPGVTDMITANRIYLGYAAMQARNAGIRQFIDLGGGFPTAGSVLNVAQAHDPSARVAVVDWDSDVADPEIGFGPILQGKGAVVVQADITDPGKVLADAALSGLIDLDQPVALIFGLVLNTMEPQQAREVVSGYADAAASGSAVTVTVTRGCGDKTFSRARAEWEAGTGCHGEEFSLTDTMMLLAGLDMHGRIGPVTGPRVAGPCDRPHVAGGVAFKL